MVEYIKNGKHKNLVFPSTSGHIVSPFQQKEDEIKTILSNNDSGCIKLNLPKDSVEIATTCIIVEENKWTPNKIKIGGQTIDGSNIYIGKLFENNIADFEITIRINLQKTKKIFGYCNKCESTFTPEVDDGIMECSCDDYATIFTKTKYIHSHNQTRQFLHFLEYMSILNIEYTLEQVSNNNNN